MSYMLELPSGRVLIVVAHPDDETLGCGGELPRWPDCVIAHTTGGSPANLDHARHAGFHTRQEYEDARRRELTCALAEVGGRELRGLGFIDQESWRHMADLTEAIHTLIEELQPDAIITHPYEGGHPDHDAAAVAVQHACLRINKTSHAPLRIEAAFYHRYHDEFRTGEFLPNGGLEIGTGELSSEASARKRRMLDCFTSQQDILQRFATRFERYRIAPQYDFTKAPHAGMLNYETLGWNITGAMWRTQAAARSQMRKHT